jgi:hypothetical protein
LINLTVFISKRLFTKINSRTHWALADYSSRVSIAPLLYGFTMSTNFVVLANL